LSYSFVVAISQALILAGSAVLNKEVTFPSSKNVLFDRADVDTICRDIKEKKLLSVRSVTKPFFS
jgi:hypothetical protein